MSLGSLVETMLGESEVPKLLGVVSEEDEEALGHMMARNSRMGYLEFKP